MASRAGQEDVRDSEVVGMKPGQRALFSGDQLVSRPPLPGETAKETPSLPSRSCRMNDRWVLLGGGDQRVAAPQLCNGLPTRRAWIPCTPSWTATAQHSHR